MRNEIPYYRVFLHIPGDMKDKLPQEYIALLDTTVWRAECFESQTNHLQRLLKAEDLHTAVFDLLLLYQRQFKVQFPPLNTPVMLYRLIKRLALPGKFAEHKPDAQRLIFHS